MIDAAGTPPITKVKHVLARAPVNKTFHLLLLPSALLSEFDILSDFEDIGELPVMEVQ